MDRVGNRDVVYTGAFLCASDEVISFDVNAESWLVSVNIVFTEEGAPRGIQLEPENNLVRIVLSQWNDSLGTCTTSPIRLGTHDNGKTLFFMATNYRIGDVNKFDIQLSLGGLHE